MQTNEPGHIGAQLFDVSAFLANHDPWTRGMNRDHGSTSRTLYLDLADIGIFKLFLEVFANPDIGIQQVRKVR